MKTQAEAQRAIELAEEHVHKADMQTSAHFCLREAKDRMKHGNYDQAYNWSKNSLAYSVGTLSSIYTDLCK